LALQFLGKSKRKSHFHLPQLRSTSRNFSFSLLSSAKWRPLQCQSGDSRRESHVGCEQDGEEPSIPFFAIASRVCELVWGQALLWRRRTSFMFRLGRALAVRCGCLFKVSSYRSWCSPKSRQGIYGTGLQRRSQHWQKYVENDGDSVEV
jgi:hypothetical protein